MSPQPPRHDSTSPAAGPSAHLPVDAAAAAQARDWLAWLASGTAEAARMRQFEQWLALPGHRRAFEYERTVWRSLGPRPALAAPPPRRAHRYRRLALATAALLALAWVAPEAWLRAQADHRSGHAIQTVALPDGSRAVLDADSAIAIRYDDHVRHIDLLRGRAWFQVAPGQPRAFVVGAQGGQVEDISTAFAVASDDSGVEAMVEQGQVRVAAADGAGWTYLQAGQRAGFTAGGRVSRLADVAPDRIAAWRQGELLLDAVEVNEAVQRIARYRPGPTFIRGDLSRLPVVNAAFRIDRPEQALDALAGTAGLSVTRLPMGVAIIRIAPAG